MENISSTSPANLTQLRHKLGMEDMCSKLLPIAIAIVMTNGLVFVLFYKRKSLRTSSNILLLGLAVCDFITGAVNIPYFIVYSFGVVSMISPIYNDFVYWMFILHTLMAISAAYHILVITAEKYLAIIQPLKHYLVTKTTVFKVLAGIWVVSFCIAIIPLVAREANTNIWLVIYSATCLVIVFLVPYGYMLYAYAAMFKAVSGRNRPSRYKEGRRLQEKSSTHRKCFLVFAIMAVVYLCCWLPYFTMKLIININVYTKSYHDAAVHKAAETIAITKYLTSAINPLLYTLFKRDFWMALRNFFETKREARFPQKTNSSLLRSFTKTYSKSTRSTRPINGNRVTRLSEPVVSPREEMEEKYLVLVSSV